MMIVSKSLRLVQRVFRVRLSVAALASRNRSFIGGLADGTARTEVDQALQSS
jgi:hypothetical protein